MSTKLQKASYSEILILGDVFHHFENSIQALLVAEASSQVLRSYILKKFLEFYQENDIIINFFKTFNIS